MLICNRNFQQKFKNSLHILYSGNNDNKNGGKSQQFYGPATNCDELGQLGYTLNGYYLVKRATDSTMKGNIGIVYCQFQQLHAGQEHGKI